MAKNQLNQELSTIIQSLFKTFLIIYRIYSPYIKTVLFLMIAYAGFKIGRYIIEDPFEKKVKSIESKLKNRSYYVLELPQRIKPLSMIRKILTAILILFAIAVPLLLKLKPRLFKKIGQTFLMQLGLLGIVILAIVWSYEIWLNRQLSDGRTDNITINELLYGMTKLMGQRAQGLLRVFLCKQKQIQRPRRQIGVCWKQKCKQARKLLKDKSDLVERLVQSALSFEWCNICRSKLPFEQFLQFQKDNYVAQQGLGEQEQVNEKNKYLSNELQRIASWIRSISPCNCSKLYWLDQIKQIKNYKACEKQLQEKEAIMVRMHAYKR